ncbi:TonB-dependent siderophore receptor [Bradyrhizobium sp.]|uniref:TonB-dependent siderophore receptor n=1 Tax=Bradyrhizobium sp. TaxID=376 RepID=UPI0039E4655C
MRQEPTTIAPAAAGPEAAVRREQGYVPQTGAAATKSATPLVETPQSISVVTKQQIEDQQPQNVREALRYTPGLVSEYRGAGGTRYDTILYRGFGGGVNYDYSYLDQLRLLGANYLVPQIDPYMLDRIEVLKGPASVLFGQGNPGGLVNLVSKLPTAQPFHEVIVQGGTYGRIQGGFDFGGPIDKEATWLYRLTGIGRMADSQVDFAKEQRVAIAPAITYRPDADTSITLLAKYQHDPYGGYFGFLPAAGTVLPLANGSRIPRNFFDGSPQYDQFDRTEASIGYKFDHRFDNMFSVASSLRYMHLDLDYKSVFTSPRGLNTTDPNNPSLYRSAIFNRSHGDALTTDNHGEINLATGPVLHKILVGVDYQQLNYAEVQGSGTAPSLSIYNPDYSLAIPTPSTTVDATQLLRQVGLYVQDQIRIERLTLLTGVRQDWADNDRTDRLSPPAVYQLDKATTWRTGAIYNFDSGLAPYVTYSTSFQPNSGADVSGNLFKPTTGQQIEGGVKYQPVGYNALLTAAVYDLTQQNVLVTDPANTNFNIQTGEVRTRGLELEARATVQPGWSWIASYAYMDNINTISTTAQGKHPTYVPDQTAGIWQDYTFQSGQLAGFGFATGVRYVGRSFADAANTITVPSVLLFDAAVHYDFGVRFPTLRGWRAQVNAQNLFDKTYVSACATATKCFYGLGRTVVGTLAYRW